ncbi:hypothetical protein CDAR_575851 [Caerostris darwini]|uniref:Uncharacterized protein n=1 Tax=Caerostris darwini TaxID=1538125 RepID=A0AAV4X8E9_9ARAC|nr:hypothetical protein CDAR_575851 [Caerostris darwini]
MWHASPLSLQKAGKYNNSYFKISNLLQVKRSVINSVIKRSDPASSNFTCKSMACKKKLSCPCAKATHSVCGLSSCLRINTWKAYGLTPLQPGQTPALPLVREEGSLASHWSVLPEGRLSRRCIEMETDKYRAKIPAALYRDLPVKVNHAKIIRT